MKFVKLPILETKRLRLRRLTRKDIPDYYSRLGSSEGVSRYMLWNPHKDVSESAASIEKTLRRYGEGSCYRWGIALRETDSLIGVVELLRFEEERCSFAYMLGEEFWGRGYGTEALTAAFDFAFNRMEIKTITADHFADNPASGRVMEKAGMKKVRLLPGKYEKNGKSFDAVEYSITAEEWNNSGTDGRSS